MNDPMRLQPHHDSPEGYKPFTAPNALRMIRGGIRMSDNQQVLPEASPIKNKVGGVFVPVKDIEVSRAWYCRVLGLNAGDCEIIGGHLCPLPMEGAGLILDTMPMWGGEQPDGAPSIQTPAFMLMTADLQGSYDYMKEIGVELVTGIEHDHWFVVKDPDGNKLMITRE